MDTLETYNEIFDIPNLNINDGIDKCFIEKIENRKKDILSLKVKYAELLCWINYFQIFMIEIEVDMTITLYKCFIIIVILRIFSFIYILKISYYWEKK